MSTIISLKWWSCLMSMSYHSYHHNFPVPRRTRSLYSCPNINMWHYYTVPTITTILRKTRVFKKCTWSNLKKCYYTVLLLKINSNTAVKIVHHRGHHSKSSINLREKGSTAANNTSKINKFFKKQIYSSNSVSW